MKHRRREIAKVFITRFMIFVMTVFVISDLINLHLKVIFHIDLYATQTLLNGKVKKAKDDKFKVKIFCLPPSVAARLKTFHSNKPLEYLLITHEIRSLEIFIRPSCPRAPPVFPGIFT